MELAQHDPLATTEYGGAQRYWWLLFINTEGKLDATLAVQNKTATRHSEAMFVRFNPPATAAAAVEFNSLGQWVPATSNLTIDGGSKIMRAVTDSGLRFRSPSELPKSSAKKGDRAAAGEQLLIRSLDAAVAVLGEPLAFPVPLDNRSSAWSPPDTGRYGASLLLFANTWGTGFPQWQPYRKHGEEVPGAGNFAFRFQLGVEK